MTVASRAVMMAVMTEARTTDVKQFCAVDLVASVVSTADRDIMRIYQFTYTVHFHT